ncbi:MAG: GSU2403 family nucleotidyltransferase fold protein [Ghiorsea sp.]
MKLLDDDVTVLYSKLLEQLQADTQEGVPSSGSIVKKAIGNQEYWYHQYRFIGKQRQSALGVGAPAEDWIRAMETRERLCALLASGRMHFLGARSVEANVLGHLVASGVFKSGAILVGSYAFGAICNMLGIRVDTQLTKTQDSDFEIDRTIKFAIENPKLEDSLLEAGMHAIPGFDKPITATSFRTPDKKVKVDFLTPITSNKTGKAIRLTKHGVHADGLKYLGYLIEEPVNAALVTQYGTFVTVPQPARFAFHKLIVATQRPAMQEAKRRKDVLQAALILRYLLEYRAHDLRPAWDALPHASWKKLALQAAVDWLDPEIVEHSKLSFIKKK